MSERRPSRPGFSALILIPVGLMLFAGSCRTTSTGRSPKNPDDLRGELARARVTRHELEEENDQQGLRLIEQRALIEQLEQRLLMQQQMLDDAIQEVVRVKAKQRSLESRAQAASELAEAEIALSTLRDSVSDTNRPKLANAERLLARANQEFDGQNFGGALYLIGQAKSLIRSGMLLSGERKREELLENEIPFALPLRLALNTRGNLRTGPGQSFSVLVTLEAGTPITGYSSKDSWLRVESEDGRTGWIHRSLVSAR